MKTLPPFEETAKCPKCGHGDVKTIYHDRGMGGVCDRHGVRWDGGEHLARVCQRCHYGWAEACIEAPAPEAPGSVGE